METDKYKKRNIEQGLCRICGKPLDRQNGTRCTSCLEKQKRDSKETYYRLIELHICPKCRKNKLYGDERICLECKAKNAEKQWEYRKNDEEAYNKYHKEHKKRTYQQRKEAGLCPKCGKQISDKRYVLCERCRDKRIKAR